MIIPIRSCGSAIIPRALRAIATNTIPNTPSEDMAGEECLIGMFHVHMQNSDCVSFVNKVFR